MTSLAMYDKIIVGGGISGLYMAYKNGDKNTLLIEKYGYLGGRIYTEHKDGLSYESGAGRIGKDHTILIGLISELGLQKKLYPIGKDKLYFIDNKWIRTDRELMEHYAITRFKSLKDIWLFILYSKKEFKKDLLLSVNFVGYLLMILDENEINCIKDTFGYITEINDNNAYVTLETILHSFDIENEEFYVLVGGLNQIVVELTKKIKKMGVEIRLNTELLDIERLKKQYYCTVNDGGNELIFTTNKLILGLPIERLSKIGYFCDNPELKNMVSSRPLMRIYARYPQDNTGQVWFNQMPKVVTDNPIQMIIPIDSKNGLVMISYSDNYIAEYWNSLNNQGLLEKTLDSHLKKMFKGVIIPKPKWITVHHWKHGSHIWNYGYSQQTFLKQIFSKYAKKNLYITCDCFSNKQTWIEGALEQAEYVLEII